MDTPHWLQLQIFLLAQAAQRCAVKKHKRRIRRQLTTPAPRHPAEAPRMRSEKQRIGDHYENLARQHLEQAGLILLSQQLHCPGGEIDLIFRDHLTLVFVEVRSRRHSSHGGAAASVGRGKQRKLLHAANWFLPSLTRQYFGGKTPPCRIDVITFDPTGMLWLRAAIGLTQDK